MSLGVKTKIAILWTRSIQLGVYATINAGFPRSGAGWRAMKVSFTPVQGPIENVKTIEGSGDNHL